MNLSHALNAENLTILSEDTDAEGKRCVFVVCPGRHLHATKSEDKDCRIVDDDGAPHLHCFHKKSLSGIATPNHDLNVIRARLKIAEKLAEELRHGKARH